MNHDIVGDRIASPYIARDHDAIAALVPLEVDKVTVLARHGDGDFTVRFFIEDELVAKSERSRTVLAGVEKALFDYRGNV